LFIDAFKHAVNVKGKTGLCQIPRHTPGDLVIVFLELTWLPFSKLIKKQKGVEVE